MSNIDKDYKLVPFNEITDEAREIAVRWMEGFEVWMKSDIREKHKLASDIMNYARRHADVSLDEVSKIAVAYGKRKFENQTDGPMKESEIPYAEVDFARGFVACSEYLKDK